MDATQALIEARDLIKDPARWTQGAYARDADGRAVSSTSPEACQWCAMGVVAKVAGRHDFLTAMRLSEEMLTRLDRAAGESPLVLGSITKLNDHQGHEAVLKMFAKAINEGAV